MKKTMLLACVLLVLLQCAKESAPTERAPSGAPQRPPADEYSEVNRIAVVTVDALRMREEPNVGSRILGRLMKDTEVLLLRRSQLEATVSSTQDYWYELVTLEGIRAWSFGKYLLITDKQTTQADFVCEYERSSEMPEQDVDLAIVNELERASMYAEADRHYSNLLELPMVRYLADERRLLRKSSFAWLRDDPREIYLGIAEQLSRKMPIMAYVPPSVDFGTYAGEFWGIFSNCELNDFVLDNLEDEYSMSDLIILGDDRALFYIDQAAWGSKYNRLLLCISKISGAVFEPLNNKYELTTVMFAFQMAYADPTAEKFEIRYPFYKTWIYGMAARL